jgi:hypothetical protein
LTQREFRTESHAADSGIPNTPEQTYYDILEVLPSASAQKIRQSYRELSKLYHPDTTMLPPEIATVKFQTLNEAYATLSSPERRFTYDLSIGYSRYTVIQPRWDLDRPVSEARKYRSSAYLDPTDRPLSAGEITVLFVMGLTFVGCLLLALWVGVSRGDLAWQTPPPVAGMTSAVEFLVKMPENRIFSPSSAHSYSFTIEKNGI